MRMPRLVRALWQLLRHPRGIQLPPRPDQPNGRVAPISRVQQALDWIEADPEHRTPYAAAQQFSLTPSVVYRAHKRRQQTGRGCCPCCGQVLPPGFDPEA